jgi:hypothetical protein
MWKHFNAAECMTGWNLLDFVNFSFLIVYSISFAIILLCIVLAGVCCGPCIYTAVRNYFREQN